MTKLLNSVLSIALLGSAAPVARAAEADPVVQVTGGQIKGRMLPGGVAAFKGVPFAQPPVGDLRWRDPAPVKSWTGVRDASNFGPECAAQISHTDGRQQEGSQEDCLSLNVWTGEWPSKSPKPVMVWLHGGGGRTSAEQLDGTSLSRRGVVLVSINFRHGILGYFAHPGLRAESPRHSSSNYGFLDQVAALQWIHENIGKFGGDPGNVTLFGQSLGGVYTAWLVASPSAKGLIHRAIQESGTPLVPIGTLAQDEHLGVQFAESLKAPPGAADAVKFLRAMPSDEVIKAATLSPLYQLDQSLKPVIDGHLIPTYPGLIFQQGNEPPIPMITGSTAREEPRKWDMAAMKRVVKANFGSLTPKAEEFYGLANGGTGKDDPLYGPALAQIATDTKHRCGAVIESIWRSSRGRTTYQYQFDVPTPGEAFTRHGADVRFVFGNLPPNGVTDADRTVSNTIQTYWTNFAKTGNPNGNGLPEWPKFDTTRPYLEFRVHDGPAMRKSLRPEICSLYIEALKETIPANTAASAEINTSR